MSQRTSSSARGQKRAPAQQRIRNVEKQNALLEQELSKLQNLLKDTLSRDAYFDLDSLKRQPHIVPFKKKKPSREQFLPPQPAGMSKMLPWKKQAYERAYEQGEKRYASAERAYQTAKTKHQILMNGRRDKAFDHNQKIEALKQKFAAGDAPTVEDYFGRVLEASAYPESLPGTLVIGYRPDSRLLLIDHDLPAFEAMPGVKAYRYVKARDEVAESALPESQRKKLYRSVIAQIPLRTIHAVFSADRAEKIDRIIFCGYVNTTDPGTGQLGRFCLVSLSLRREQFRDLNLELVDPQVCLQHLNARVSRKPESLVAVRPIEVISDVKTPPSMSRAAIAEQQPRRADDVYHLVSTPALPETARDLPIPGRAGAADGSSSISPKGARFVELATAYADRTEAQAEPVPFQQYWPTYESMDEAQQQWYFYWRGQMRRGNRLPTDLSYLFVHLYEVINMIGFDTPQEAFGYLEEFWRYYRQLQPNLDRYLPDWIADFIVIRQLAPNALRWYSEVAKIAAVKNSNFAIEAWAISDEPAAALSNNVIFELANYDPAKSKFHKRFAEPSKLDSAYKRALHAVDEATRQEHGQSLFQLHAPEHAQVIRRTPFESAVHAYPRTAIEVAAVHDWANVAPLAEMLNSIVKHADNVLREQAGYKYRVRGIQLTDACKAVIETALRPQRPKREISIDPAKVEQLAKESETLRARLLADEAPASETQDAQAALRDQQLAAAASWVPEPASAEPALDESAAQAPEAAIDWSRIGGRRKARAWLRLRRFRTGGSAPGASQPAQSGQLPASTVRRAQAPPGDMATAAANGAGIAGASGFLDRPADTPADLLTDLAEVAHIMGAGDGKRAQLIAVMMDNNWECPEANIQSEFPGEFINLLIDEINSIALTEIGDNLIFEEDGQWIVLDEYRDETEYILQHPDYLEA